MKEKVSIKSYKLFRTHYVLKTVARFDFNFLDFAIFFQKDILFSLRRSLILLTKDFTLLKIPIFQENLWNFLVFREVSGAEQPEANTEQERER